MALVGSLDEISVGLPQRGEAFEYVEHWRTKEDFGSW